LDQVVCDVGEADGVSSVHHFPIVPKSFQTNKL
jgi:hypothetical protein